MKCVRCGSMRTMKFVDGFGNRRVFCENCLRSFLDVNKFNGSMKDFQNMRPNLYYNPSAVIKH